MTQVETFDVGAAGTPAPAPSPAPQHTAAPVISLEKKLEKQAPRLVSLAKKATVSLTKHKLNTLQASVAFVLDASGSMSGEFSRGHVQSVLDRIAVLAVQFDDDGVFGIGDLGHAALLCHVWSLV